MGTPEWEAPIRSQSIWVVGMTEALQENEHCVGILLAALLLMGGGSGLARGDAPPDLVGDEEPFQQKRPDRVRNGAETLPGWAEPSTRTSDRHLFGERKEVVPKQAPPPSDPDPVPVDGGLIWLVLAGGGYAGWRLQIRERGSAQGL